MDNTTRLELKLFTKVMNKPSNEGGFESLIKREAQVL
jgi:hypothetical protein